MKTVVKIDPEREYDSAKQAITAIGMRGGLRSEIASLDSSVDNLKTVINVLLERAAPKKRVRPKKLKKKAPKKKHPEFSKLPSEKFPDLEVKENIIKAAELPKCKCCHKEMTDSGMFKTAEKMEVIPKKYYIVRHKRVIYCCKSCHGNLYNAPLKPSISPSSNYGDSVIVDVALSKYCDLLPIERYSAMAARDGLEGLPANSLVGLTHLLVEFLMSIYEKLMAEVRQSQVILMDETTHRMLEGDPTANWYLWGFATARACVFEAHGTRSGDVAQKFLAESSAEFLLTDGYGGYKKALRELALKGKNIEEVFCNAHAYRYFEQASVTWEQECQPFLELYGKIYQLEREAVDIEQKTTARCKMRPLFDQLRSQCEIAKSTAMANSSFTKAINYFENHVEGLVKCLDYIQLPLDNNFSEGLLRSPVIGRKTWYGTHSKKGARTNAVMFSIVESCKINSINPRKYFDWVIERLHNNQEVLTPSQYSDLNDSG